MRGAQDAADNGEMEHSRARFLVATALGAGVAVSLDRLVARADSVAHPGLDALNAAIELERAGIKAYDDAAATKLLSPDVLKLALLFRGDHSAHLAALIAAVRASGHLPSDKTAKLTYPPLTSQTDIVRFARVVEERAASTYLSVIPDLRDRDLAQTLASILGVETVHVGMLAQALGEFPPYPTGFVR